ncbi:MAG: hypothetical protein JEZ09_14970 [Salinivirgaceae bacterium]|nr:hypothetical protein [Salinivirgaceae bacterium]
MYEEKSSIEKLQEFAKNTQRKIEYFDATKSVNVFSQIPVAKRKVSISNLDGQNTFFISHNDTQKLGDSSFYSGFFFPMNIPSHIKIDIRRKNIIDKLNPFFNESNFKSGSKKFDKQVVIKQNDTNLTHELFSKRKIQELTITSLKLDERLKIVVNPFAINFVPELIDQSIFGILLCNDWIFESTKIEEFFSLIEKFRYNMNSFHLLEASHR